MAPRTDAILKPEPVESRDAFRRRYLLDAAHRGVVNAVHLAQEADCGDGIIDLLLHAQQEILVRCQASDQVAG